MSSLAGVVCLAADKGIVNRLQESGWLPGGNGAGSNGASPGSSKAVPYDSSTGISFTGPSGDVVDLIRGAHPEVDELTRASAYLHVVYIHAAIAYRAEKIAEPPLLVVEETDDGEEPVEEHELAQILREPSVDYDMGEQMEMTSTWIDLDGESLWAITRTNAERIAAIYAFSGEEFETIPAQDRVFGGYRVFTASGSDVMAPEDVVHFRYAAPFHRREPVSPTDVALRWANLGHQVRRTIKNVLSNVVIPPGIFTYPQDYMPDKEERDENRDEIRQRYQGVRNAGETMVLYGGLTYDKMEQDVGDVLPGELLSRVEANVALAFRMRPEVLGFMVGLENSPWSHMDTARKITYEDAIKPDWRRKEKAMTRRLLSEEDRERGLRIRFDRSQVEALQEDEAQRARVAQRAQRLWTVNEGRIYTGQEPLPDGDPRGELLIAEVGRGMTSPQSGEPTDPDPDPGNGGGQASAGPPSGVKIGGVDPEIVRVDPLSAKDRKWAWFDHYAKGREADWVREIAAELDGQRDEVLRLAERYLRMEGDRIDPESVQSFMARVEEFLEDDAMASLRARALPLMSETGEGAVRQVAGELGISFDRLEPGLERFAREESAFLARVMGETTGQKVAATVERGMTEGDLVGDLRGRLEELPEFDRQRAQLVARTETTRATNGAQRRTLSDYQDETGRRIEKSWLSARDDRVRDDHDALDDGSWIPVNEDFPNGLKSPGEPNCRCTALYRMADGGQA